MLDRATISPEIVRSIVRLAQFSANWHEHAWYCIVSLEQHVSCGIPRFLSPGVLLDACIRVCVHAYCQMQGAHRMCICTVAQHQQTIEALTACASTLASSPGSLLPPEVNWAKAGYFRWEEGAWGRGYFNAYACSQHPLQYLMC